MLRLIFKRACLVLCATLLASSSTVLAENEEVAPAPVALELSFADANWDGKTIPKGQQCLEFGGNGQSPPISVKGIPPGTSELVLAFSDGSYPPCDQGGHGVVAYRVASGVGQVVVPSIPGQTFDLPEDFALIREHCGRDLAMQPGAYIGPCPGVGNIYYVTVEALSESGEGDAAAVLGSGRLEIGTYR